MTNLAEGIKATKAGLVVNICLVFFKLFSGIVGNSYALVADAIESSTDILSSLIVLSGLRVASRPADEDHHYGHGKAESLAAAVVALMLLGAAASIAILAIREIFLPHHVPMPFTLAVVGGVVIVKETLFRTVFKVGNSIGSTAVKTDAWHHRSDAITSAAAFIGIALALWGGERWAAADDWAALFASLIIGANGVRFLRGAAGELMDRVPDRAIVVTVEDAARGTDGVLAIEKVRVRKMGMEYLVDLHVQADPALSLRDAHILSGKVKGAIKTALPAARDVLIHMEPFEAEPQASTLP